MFEKISLCEGLFALRTITPNKIEESRIPANCSAVEKKERNRGIQDWSSYSTIWVDSCQSIKKKKERDPQWHESIAFLAILTCVQKIADRGHRSVIHIA